MGDYSYSRQQNILEVSSYIPHTWDSNPELLTSKTQIVVTLAMLEMLVTAISVPLRLILFPIANTWKSLKTMRVTHFPFQWTCQGIRQA
jgi:hypothetical protein